MALPYMPLFIDDYLKDTIYLTAEEHGAYLLLIMHYWQKERALDNSGGKLAKVVRMTEKRWSVVQKSLEEFFTIEEDIWNHGRINFELEKAFKKSQQARFAQSAGVRKRMNEKLGIDVGGRGADAGREVSGRDADAERDIGREKAIPESDESDMKKQLQAITEGFGVMPE